MRKQKDNFKEKEISSLANAERERESERERRMLGWLGKPEEREWQNEGGLERSGNMGENV